MNMLRAHNDLELMRIHVDTLFTHDEAGRMLRVNEPEGKAAPRFFLGRTNQGSVCRFRSDIDDDLVNALESAARDEAGGEEFMIPPYGSSHFEELLARSASVQRTWSGPAFCFPNELVTPSGAVVITQSNANLLLPHLAAWFGDVEQCQPVLALVIDDQAVSLCCSVRKTTTAHEAGVETALEFRGRGYAAQAVGAWASAVRSMGRVPLYSTSWQNTNSLAVARKLGLIRYGTTLHIT